MSSSEAPKTWLSQEAHDRLQAELDELIAARPAVAAEINARREEGDLRVLLRDRTSAGSSGSPR